MEVKCVVLIHQYSKGFSSVHYSGREDMKTVKKYIMFPPIFFTCIHIDKYIVSTKSCLSCIPEKHCQKHAHFFFLHNLSFKSKIPLMGSMFKKYIYTYVTVFFKSNR